MRQDHLWQRLEQQFQQQWSRGRLPHALIFAGASAEIRRDFIDRCLNVIKTPDLHRIDVIPEKLGGTIKVDQIRELQHQVNAVLTGTKWVVLIDPVNKLNRSAMNALLKVLEEPPEPVTFFLSTDHLETVIPTIRSRCCHYYLPTNDHVALDSVFLNDWCDVLQKRQSACSFAQFWGKDRDLLSVLEKMYFILAMALKETNHTVVKQFCTLTTPLWLWDRFDHLHQLLQKLHENMAMNTVLAIESMLVSHSEGLL